jgi:predicted ArsR family transcriptional regulator
MADFLRRQLLDSTRGRIVALLRGGARTADDLATALGVTRSAVRIHLAGMERDGLVARAGTRAGITRPSLVFELAPQVEQLLSKAYLPLLTGLVQVFADELPPTEQERLLREAGRRLAAELLRGRMPGGTMPARAAAASQILNEELGALTRVEQNGHLTIRGASCPLSALTGKHRGVCLAMESLVSAVVGAPVVECCDRSQRPRCCFEVVSARARPRQLRRKS